MLTSLAREAMIEPLLDALERERYMRRPLLYNLIDELSAVVVMAPACEIARHALALLDETNLNADDFSRRIRTVRDAVIEIQRTSTKPLIS